MSAFDLCGVALQSPFIAASGPLSYNAAGMLRLHRAGAGAVVTKTIRLEACINPIPHMVRNSRDSLVNCEKWADLPPEAWIASEIPQAHQAGVVVIASVGHTLPESSRLVEKVVAAGASMVELVSYDEADLAPMVADARRRVGCPILVKLSPNGRNLAEIARRCVAAGADAVTACDSVGPVLRIDIRTGRPLLGGVGGAGWLSGSAIKPMILQRVAELRQVLTCPIIGLGGVTDAADVLEMLMAGANFVGLCSALILRGPEYLGTLRQETAASLEKLGYADVAAVSGKAIPFLTATEQTGRIEFAYDAGRCTGCGQCVKVCCYQARTLTAGKEMSVNERECRDCGLCASVCPTQALTVAGPESHHV